MLLLTPDKVRNIVQEIEETAERDRRARAKRRVDIYRDGGRPFLIEKILKEFGRDALAEMRITPINLLKKIVDKRAAVYKRPPVRKAASDSEQALVDFYVKELALNVTMAKANRYLVLSSNTALYIRPMNGKLCASVVPNYLYSIVPDPSDLTVPEVFIFPSSFADEGNIAPDFGLPSATGVQGFSEDRGYGYSGDLVASQEKETEENSKQYVFWSDHQHLTANSNGSAILVPELGEEQFVNPIGLMPVVNIARDRDNETWATQGEDMVDLTLAIQMGWTDLMTIAKHQGFSILTVISEEEPKKLQIGVNRAVWLKINPQGPQPSISYVQGQSPLAQYKELLMELLGLLLTTNNMEPGAIGGQASQKTFTSGFHALIAMADSLEAVEADKPIMLKAEEEAWKVISAWHNWMFDNNTLSPEARALGKFPENFVPSIQFADIMPLESEDERINRVKTLIDMGLITKVEAIKKIHGSELSDEQAQAKLEEIDAEKQANMDRFQLSLGTGVNEGSPEPGAEGDDAAPEEQSDDEDKNAGKPGVAKK